MLPKHNKKEGEFFERCRIIAAKKLNIPLGTVKAHIFRGRELLNKYLKDKMIQF